MVFDYTSSVTEEHEPEVREGPIPLLSSAIQTGFFKETGECCRYCVEPLGIVFDDSEDGGGGYDTVFRVLACLRCGWWYEEDLAETYIGDDARMITTAYRFAVLRKFDVAAADLPISSLRDELLKRPDILRDIHPARLERLAADVFRDHLDAEVTHIGRSGDGGIDLLVVRGDVTAAVQVKRRSRSGTGEGVAAIRELVGAMGLSQRRHGVFLTTADRFTRGALQTAGQAIELGLVESMELVDFPRFVEILELTSARAEAPWEVAFESGPSSWRHRGQTADDGTGAPPGDPAAGKRTGTPTPTLDDAPEPPSAPRQMPLW